jgi:hypothetical protein
MDSNDASLRRLFFAQHSIKYIDALPPLQADLRAGSGFQPYNVNCDGHSNLVGHRVIAEDVRSCFHPGN